MFSQRIDRLRKKLTEINLDALLVSNFYNILYLTGFKTLTTDEREAFVLVTHNNAYLFTDERYIEKNSKFKIADYELRIKLVEPHKGLLSHLEEIAGAHKIQKVGFETEDLRFFEYEDMKYRLANVELVPTQRLIMLLREIKDDGEIEKTQKACEVTDQCLRDVIKTLKVGQSEKEIAFKIEMWIKEKNYDVAFDPIVALDANASLPHYNTKTGNGVVKNSSVILLDFGIKHGAYLSDVTRMVFFGKPNDRVLKAYGVLQKAQRKTEEEISRLKNLSAVDEFCRSAITTQGFPTYPHSTGHGVGLEIHEYPKVSFHSHDVKKEGQVFTVEPGIYIPGKWGMRVEDTVVVKNGRAEALTRFSKELLIIS